MKITATVITRDEEHNIEDALRSLFCADEIVVVDSGSTDRTVEIARRYTDKVLFREWQGYSSQKNFAAAQANHDWILNLDADERISPELAEEVRRLKTEGAEDVAGFEIPRRTFYLGRWIRHGGWYPDRKLRLYDRNRGEWRGDYVHESVKTDGAVGRLSGNINHYTVRNASEHHLRLDRYTTLSAEEMIENGRQVSAASIVFAPIAAFLRSYVFRRGFLDGVPGIAIAYFAAHYVFLRNLKLWELNKERSSQEDNQPE